MIGRYFMFPKTNNAFKIIEDKGEDNYIVLWEDGIQGWIKSHSLKDLNRIEITEEEFKRIAIKAELKG